MREGSRLTTALILLPVSYNPDEAGKREPVATGAETPDANGVQTWLVKRSWNRP
jgi:hypothetical protein